MAFTIEGLAQELGIDPATLASKGDVVARYNGYLSGADTQYREAKESLEQAKREQEVITAQIVKFGETEASLGELRSANAAYKAALEEAKKGGFNIDLSGLPTPKIPAAADPLADLRSRQDAGFRQMGAAMRVASKYQSIHGKPFIDDPIALVDAALAARMSVEDYAEQKYKFADESARINKENATKHDAEVGAAAVKKYQEDNPTRSPMEQRGVASKYPQITKPKDAAEGRKFANLPPKERLAQSVARGRAMAASSDVA